MLGTYLFSVFCRVLIMNNFKLNTCFKWTIIACMLFISACSSDTIVLNSPNHSQLIRDDLAEIHKKNLKNLNISEIKNDKIEDNSQKKKTGFIEKLSLSDAINRGIKSNFDARVSALEALAEQDDIVLDQLTALPNIRTSAQYQTRTNIASSSSESILTGTESLQPSQSSDKTRRTASANLTLNLMDSALALIRSGTTKDEAKISVLRHEKVLQNIERDILSAYMRAFIYQVMRDETSQLIKDANKQIKHIRSARNQKLISVHAAT